MKFVQQSFEILSPVNGTEILKAIEIAGRTCYKSEARITDESASDFVKMLIRNGHEAMIEHASITVRFICSRSVSHALVRHRMASFAQESTIYCDYSGSRFNKEVTFILPTDLQDKTSSAYSFFAKTCLETEKAYLNLRALGISNSIARNILPNGTKTELIITANLREWRAICKLRTSKQEGKETKELIGKLLQEFTTLLPEVFSDIKHLGNE